MYQWMSIEFMHTNHLFRFLGREVTTAEAEVADARVRPMGAAAFLLDLARLRVGLVAAGDGAAGDGADISTSSSSPKSVPASVPDTTLSLGVGTTPSSPLSWVRLLSLSPPISPVVSSFVLPRFRPARLLPAADADGSGEDETDTVARNRRSAMRASNVSSKGNVNS